MFSKFLIYLVFFFLILKENLFEPALNDDEVGFFGGGNNFDFGEGMSKRKPFFLFFDLLKKMGNKSFYPMFVHFIFVTMFVVMEAVVGVVVE